MNQTDGLALRHAVNNPVENFDSFCSKLISANLFLLYIQFQGNYCLCRVHAYLMIASVII